MGVGVKPWTTGRAARNKRPAATQSGPLICSINLWVMLVIGCGSMPQSPHEGLKEVCVCPEGPGPHGRALTA